MQMIAREAEWARRGKPARLILKTNTLSDIPIIRALYAASQAGVQIDLIVRGVCCLRPGVPGVSENIRVVSVIGRFLEHSRIYYFHNGGRFQIYSGSADLMRRNLDRRVEILFPLEDLALKKQVRDEILEVYLKRHGKSPRAAIRRFLCPPPSRRRRCPVQRPGLVPGPARSPKIAKNIMGQTRKSVE